MRPAPPSYTRCTQRGWCRAAGTRRRIPSFGTGAALWIGSRNRLASDRCASQRIRGGRTGSEPEKERRPESLPGSIRNRLGRGLEERPAARLDTGPEDLLDATTGAVNERATRISCRAGSPFSRSRTFIVGRCERARPDRAGGRLSGKWRPGGSKRRLGSRAFGRQARVARNAPVSACGLAPSSGWAARWTRESRRTVTTPGPRSWVAPGSALRSRSRS